MSKQKYQPPVVDFSKTRKSLTVPNQSMSIRTILEKYTRGIPVDIVKREPIYLDQDEFDLEKLKRLDFSEKAALADELRERAQNIKDELIADEEERLREQKAIDDEKAQALQGAQGIVKP